MPLIHVLTLPLNKLSTRNGLGVHSLQPKCRVGLQGLRSHVQWEGHCGGSEGTCGQVVLKWLDRAAKGTVRRGRGGTGSLPRDLGKTSRTDLSASPGGESEEGMGER